MATSSASRGPTGVVGAIIDKNRSNCSQQALHDLERLRDQTLQLLDADLREAFDRSVGMAKKFQRIGRRHGYDFHSRAPGGLDAEQGVFKNDASLRRHAQKLKRPSERHPAQACH